MSIDMQVGSVVQQSTARVPAPETSAVPEGKTNTSLVEIQDKVHLSPEGRALLARMGGADTE